MKLFFYSDSNPPGPTKITCQVVFVQVGVCLCVCFHMIVITET